MFYNHFGSKPTGSSIELMLRDLSFEMNKFEIPGENQGRPLRHRPVIKVIWSIGIFQAFLNCISVYGGRGLGFI